MSKTHTFWRAPAGHEDIAMEPGTAPGVYGSPVHPPPGLLSIHGHGHNGGHAHYSPKSPEGSYTTLHSEATPRMQSMTLADLQGASSPPGGAGHGIGTRVASPNDFEPASPRKDGALEDEQEQGEDEEPDGNEDNYCVWTKAKPQMMLNVLQRGMSREEGQDASASKL